MAEIRVYGGQSGHNFMWALEQARPGDVIAIDPGEYMVNSIYINNVRIVGLGVSGAVTLHGSFDIRGNCQMSNVTIRAPHFHNALNVKEGARLDLDGCTIFGEPAAKYPAIFSRGGILMVYRTMVYHDKSEHGVYIEQGGELRAVGSGLAWLCVVGARATLTDTHLFSLSCRDRAHVESQGGLQLTPGEPKRGLVVAGESVCLLDRVQTTAGSLEALCDEAFVRLGRADVPDGESLVIYKKGHAVVETSAPSVTVKDFDARQAPEDAPEPKVVVWHPRNARDFETAILPKLHRGDTIMVEEGEYHLGDLPIRIGVDIAGKGRAERTVINGSLAVMAGCDTKLSNITVRAPEHRNAVSMMEGASLAMTNVIVGCAPTTQTPVVYVSDGTVTMTDCVVAASAAETVGLVDIDKGAHLDARDCHLGWLRVWDESSAALTACSSMFVWASNKATVTSVDDHFIASNDGSLRHLIVDKGAEAHFDQITTDTESFEGLADSGRLRIERMIVADNGSATFFGEADAEIDVCGDSVEILGAGAPATATASATAGVPQSSAAEPGERRRATEEALEDGSRHVPPVDGDPLAQIMALTGLSKVKEQIQTFTQVVKFNQARVRRGLKGADITMHSLFLGNPGTGKTTVARLLGKALFEAGAIERDVFVEVGRRDLVSENIGGSAAMTQAVLESARGGVLFIDEAYSLHQERNNEFAQEAVDTLLAYMENHRDEIVVIFAGYTDRMQDFLSMNPGLKSRIPNRFDFEDYSADEIATIGYRNLKSEQYDVAEDGYRRVVAAKYARSADKSNGRWVRNFNQDLITEMVRRVMSAGSGDPEDLTSITDADLRSLAGAKGDGQEVEELLAQLDSMVGLASVKEWVHKLVNRVVVDRRRAELDGTVSRPNYHMVFTGNPGTGKTTVAGIIAQLFYHLGILENPTVKVVERSQLVGRYVGETEQKTSRAIDEAMGGVLFVDEAYQLYLESSYADFGKQAIETFMTRLEDDRDKFVVMFAGYTTEMDRFLEANPGLRSRIPLTLEFPDFSPDEVAQLVVSRLSRDWVFDTAVVADIAAATYARQPPGERTNGRWARNFAERLETEQIEYIAAHDISGPKMREIPEDVIRALAEPGRRAAGI